MHRRRHLPAHDAPGEHIDSCAPPCRGSRRAGPGVASGVRPCSAPRPEPRGEVAARPSSRRRPQGWLAQRAQSAAPGLRRAGHTHTAAPACAAAPRGVDIPTGRSAAPCRSARPVNVTMRVDELPHDLNRQSSSACAKNALASFKLSLALRTSRTSLKGWSLLKNRDGPVHGARWHLARQLPAKELPDGPSHPACVLHAAGAGLHLVGRALTDRRAGALGASTGAARRPREASARTRDA